MAYVARNAGRSVPNRKNFSKRRNFSRNNRWNKRGSNNNRQKKRGQFISRDRYISTLQTPDNPDQPIYDGKLFSEFNLNTQLAANLKSKGFERTTEIQEKVIPMVLSGSDVLGISETGSGKTGAFLIPIIEKLLADPSQKLLVVAPTRELASQIAKEAISLVKGTRIYLAIIVGGESMRKQMDQLQRGVDIVVSTPGRLNDLVKRGDVKLSDYKHVVIDEVDRMLDMGFIKDISFIFKNLPVVRQSLFFSATLNKKVEITVATFSKSFEVVRLAENTPIKSVVQSVVDYTHKEEKIELLEEILRSEEVSKAIIFVETKHYADKVDKILHKNKFRVGVIHGNKRQNVRRRVIDMFKTSKIDVLVATNVAARGIDIDDITHVINLDEPQTYDEYIHRIGRTGRNGKKGTAYTFVERKGGKTFH